MQFITSVGMADKYTQSTYVCTQPINILVLYTARKSLAVSKQTTQDQFYFILV